MKVLGLYLVGCISLISGPAFVVAQLKQEKQVQEAQVLDGKEVTEKPKILHKPEPSYTESALDNGIEGTVILQAVFASSGKVTNIEIVNELSNGLTDKAIEAARRIKFKPARKNGKAVSTYLRLEYNFDIYYDASRVTKQPTALQSLQVPRTEEAKNKKVKGTVLLNVGLSKEGIVRGISVVKGLPYGLTENVIATLRKTRFQPAEFKGRPVAWSGSISYTFP